jgi:hypothetical protein
MLHLWSHLLTTPSQQWAFLGEEAHDCGSISGESVAVEEAQ